MEIFDLILEMSNLLDMKYGSRDDRELPPAERRARRDLMMVGERQHPHCGSRSRICMEEANLTL